jgi:hypothetical protein
MWFRLVTLSLRAVTLIVTFIRERQLMAAGETKAKAEATEAAAKAQAEMAVIPEPENAEVIRRLREGSA